MSVPHQLQWTSCIPLSAMREVRQTRVGQSSAQTLDCGVIVFDKLASHEANGESGLSNTSGFGAEISGGARGINEEEPTTKDNGIEFTHPGI